MYIKAGNGISWRFVSLSINSKQILCCLNTVKKNNIKINNDAISKVSLTMNNSHQKNTLQNKCAGIIFPYEGIPSKICT